MLLRERMGLKPNLLPVLLPCVFFLGSSDPYWHAGLVPQLLVNWVPSVVVVCHEFRRLVGHFKTKQEFHSLVVEQNFIYEGLDHFLSDFNICMARVLQ